MKAEELIAGAPEGAAPFSLGKAAAFLPAATLLGGLVGGAAAGAQGWFAPLILYPLLIGIVLGAVLFILSRTAQTANRATVVVGALLAVGAAVVAEHYVSYRVVVSRQEENRELQLARAAFGKDLGRPTGFADYLRREAQRGRPLFGKTVARGTGVWLTWGLDALLILVAALAVVLPGLNLPYCGDCQTWYRTIRSGRLKRPFAMRLSEMLGIALPEKPSTIRFRLLACGAGCGPTGVELLWRRRRRENGSAMVWLTPQGRDQVQRVLDEARAARKHPPTTDN